jgi:trk system potassium uptake protein TrkA
MSRQFVVIGLGRLGASMIRTLDSLGHGVLGIDSDEDRIQELSEELPNTHLVAADATEANVLRDLDVQQFDGAAVVIGEDMEASILATATLKELEVQNIVARALTSLHARILKRIGADRVIEPEADMGEQVARSIASPMILDYVELGEDEALIEAEVPDEWVDKSLSELELSSQYGITVIALKSKGKAGSIPRADTVLHTGDVMVLGGPKKNLDELDLLQG